MSFLKCLLSCCGFFSCARVQPDIPYKTNSGADESQQASEVVEDSSRRCSAATATDLSSCESARHRVLPTRVLLVDDTRLLQKTFAHTFRRLHKESKELIFDGDNLDEATNDCSGYCFAKDFKEAARCIDKDYLFEGWTFIVDFDLGKGPNGVAVVQYLIKKLEEQMKSGVSPQQLPTIIFASTHPDVYETMHKNGLAHIPLSRNDPKYTIETVPKLLEKARSFLQANQEDTLKVSNKGLTYASMV